MELLIVRAVPKILLPSCLLLCLCGGTVRAQDVASRSDSLPGLGGGRAPEAQATAPAPSSPMTQRPRNVTVWAATARNQSLATRQGWRHDRSLYLVGIRKTWPIGEDNGSVSWSYAADLLPFVASTPMPSYSMNPRPCNSAETCLRFDPHTAYAFGIAPLGFVTELRATPQFALQVAASGGTLYFTQAIPDPLGHALNFMANMGSLAEFRVTRSLALSAGYRWNHISNGGMGRLNPGMNSNMAEFGLTFIR